MQIVAIKSVKIEKYLQVRRWTDYMLERHDRSPVSQMK